MNEERVAHVGINGFGRIGRQVLKIIAGNYRGTLKVGAINDAASSDVKAHLLKYDSVYGRYGGQVEADKDAIIVDGVRIPFYNTPDEAVYPWGAEDIDVVLECSGRMRDAESAAKHLKDGAKRVIISAPAKDPDITLVLGVNESEYNPACHRIISIASCTTNCIAPMAKVLHDTFGIEYGLVTTIHAYTGDQRLIDKTHKDLRRARAAGVSIVPTTTGAAKSVADVIPNLRGRLDGIAFRVPVITGSVGELTARLERAVSKGEVNEVFKAASKNPPLRGILAYSEEPLVSSDYIGDTNSCTIDALSTMVSGDRLVKVVGWYDNEWGYACRTAEAAMLVAYKKNL